MRKLSKLIGLLCLLVLPIAAHAQDFSNTYYFNGPHTDGPLTTNFTNSGVSSFFIAWHSAGSPLASCTIEVDSSTDGNTWGSGDVISSQSCASSGSALGAFSKAYVRINVTSLSGGGVTVDLKGYGGGAGGVPSTTVSGLSAYTAQGIARVTNGSSATDCTVGGGSTVVPCYYTGSVWAAISQSGASGVSTFNGRAGAVVPTSGDYTVAQVTGAAPAASPTFSGTINAAAGTTFNFANITLSNFPTLNQSTTGNAATATNLSAYPALCTGSQFSQGLSSGSNNCTTPAGGSGTTTFALTANNSGTGAVSGSTFNGSAAVTFSYNSFGASPLAGSSSLTTVGTVTSGTWNATTLALAHGGTGQTTAVASLAALLGGPASGTYSINCVSSVSCSPTAASGGGNVSTSGSPTIGFLSMFTSSTAIGNSHVDDGITTAGTITSSEPLAAPSFQTSASTAGLLSLGGAVSNPTLPTNAAGWLAPASASFTAYFLQLPSTAPSGTQYLGCGTPVANVSTCAFNTVSGTGTVTDGAGVTTANEIPVSTTTAHVLGYATTLPAVAFPVLTGDVTTAGGALATTLASVGSAGTCGDASHSCGLTFDAKGRETARANNAISIAQSSVTARYWSCQSGLGDGLNAITSGTYLQTFCYNDTGSTVTLSGVKCYIDGGSASTLNATNGAGTGLLTGAVTCTTSFAAGTQSATTTLASGDFIKFTFVADGTAKQSTWVVTGSY